MQTHIHKQQHIHTQTTHAPLTNKKHGKYIHSDMQTHIHTQNTPHKHTYIHTQKHAATQKLRQVCMCQVKLAIRRETEEIWETTTFDGDKLRASNTIPENTQITAKRNQLNQNWNKVWKDGCNYLRPSLLDAWLTWRSSSPGLASTSVCPSCGPEVRWWWERLQRHMVGCHQEYCTQFFMLESIIMGISIRSATSP